MVVGINAMNPRKWVSSAGRAAAAVAGAGQLLARIRRLRLASGGQLVAMLFETHVTHPAAEVENRQEHPEHPEFFNFMAGILWVRADSFLLRICLLYPL